MNHFQLVCFLGIIAIAHAGEDSEEKITKIIEECRTETNASIGMKLLNPGHHVLLDSTVHYYRADDVKMFALEDFPKTKTQICLTACYYKKAGITNDDGKINIDKALDDIAELQKENKDLHDKLVKVLKDCNAKYTPTKECDSIKTYFDCMLKSSKQAGIPIEE